ncbi:S1C family serine protease [Limnoglobus roseus]|uniref:Serine protease n=1 Tax=Limnoglobus roseus TaxID=2598579 RepID=A0A5C1A4J4_9BACT|nr:trypsin-like peptidase domain-containing protein [Limnoglobus roseus]QEL14031.1 serine protease [Limnoglobus roseus]
MKRTLLLLPLAALAGTLALLPSAVALDGDVKKAEAERTAVVAKVRPAVVAVCPYGGGGHGSGVVIDPEGYALTNFHVTADVSPVMSAGLADGILYDAVLVGQDKVGDVALIKLVPKKAGTPFPFVQLGDSDKVKAGDWSLAMGNPFGLSMDFTPTVTYGLVSGVNRYQPPEGGGTLEYTDCLQIDTSINPGNSGGPLFNMQGELIGINGRGSFDKRGRVNSGVGYAISINQIKNFLGHFKAGLDTDHATMGATVETENEDGTLSQMKFGTILEEADVFRRGVRGGDKLVSFAGRPLTSTNQYKNILGIFPKEWRLPLTYRHENSRKETLVRLMGLMDERANPDAPPPGQPKQPERPDPAKEAAKRSPAMKLFKEKKGYANYYFNEQQRDKLWANFQKHGDFTGVGGAWAVEGTFNANDRKGPLTLTIADTTDGSIDAKLTMNVPFSVKMPTANPLELNVPDNSGGLLPVLTQYRRLLTQGAKGFTANFSHGGVEPCYPPPADGKEVDDWAKRRVDCEVLKTKYGATECKWYFDKKDQKLIACEAAVIPDSDPCELYFGDYKPVDGRQVPHRIDVRWGDKNYGTLFFAKFEFKKAN